MKKRWRSPNSTKAQNNLAWAYSSAANRSFRQGKKAVPWRKGRTDERRHRFHHSSHFGGGIRASRSIRPCGQAAESGLSLASSGRDRIGARVGARNRVVPAGVLPTSTSSFGVYPGAPGTTAGKHPAGVKALPEAAASQPGGLPSRDAPLGLLQPPRPTGRDQGLYPPIAKA